MLDECHFLSSCILDSLPACMLTAGAVEVMVAQPSITICNCSQ